MTSIRPFQADDREAVLALAPRLTEGVASWRDGAAVAAAEQWASERGLTFITLDTGAAKTAARQFYAARGYAEEDLRLTKRLPSGA